MLYLHVFSCYSVMGMQPHSMKANGSRRFVFLQSERLKLFEGFYLVEWNAKDPKPTPARLAPHSLPLFVSLCLQQGTKLWCKFVGSDPSTYLSILADKHPDLWPDLLLLYETLLASVGRDPSRAQFVHTGFGMSKIRRRIRSNPLQLTSSRGLTCKHARQ